MEPIAIIIDLDGNLQALETVIADNESQGVRERLCPGDIVGYGGVPHAVDARERRFPQHRATQDPMGRLPSTANSCLDRQALAETVNLLKVTLRAKAKANRPTRTA